MIRKLIILLVGSSIVAGEVIGLQRLCAPPATNYYDGKLEAAKGFVYVDVPYVPQSRQNDCAPAALSMVLKYHSFPHNPKRLAEEFVESSGTQIPEMLRYLHGVGISAVTFYPTNDDSVLRLLQAGLPVLIGHSLRSIDGKPVGHMVVLVGAGPHHFVVHDPSLGRDLLVSKKVFESRWFITGAWIRRAVAIFPHGISPTPFALEYSEVAEPFEQAISQLTTTNGLKSLRETIAVNPDFLPARLALAFQLIRLERWDEAEEAFAHIVEVDPNFCWGLALEGLSYAQWSQGKLRQFKATKARFVELVSANPHMFESAPPFVRSRGQMLLQSHGQNDKQWLALSTFLQVVPHVIVMVLLFTSMFLEYSSGRGEATKLGSRWILRPSWFKRTFNLVMGAALLFLVGLQLTFPIIPLPPLTNVAFVFLIMFFGIWGVQLPFVRVEFDETGIRVYSLWKGLRTAQWHQMQSCRYSRLSNCYILRAETGRTIAIPSYLKAISTLVDRVKLALSRSTSDVA